MRSYRSSREISNVAEKAKRDAARCSRRPNPPLAIPSFTLAARVASRAPRCTELTVVGGPRVQPCSRRHPLLPRVAYVLGREPDDFDEWGRQTEATLAVIVGIKPRDEIEGMLVAQLIASHNAAMECYRRAMLRNQNFDGRHENLKQATKLSRTYAALTEALDRHRGKGQQGITVEHVHVHAGARTVGHEDEERNICPCCGARMVIVETFE